MAKASPKKPETGTSVPAIDIEPLIAANQRGLLAAAEANAHALQRMSKVSTEMFRFVNERLKQDRDVVKEFATCTSPQDAAVVCGKFFENTVKQYSEELGLLAAIYVEQAMETMDDAAHQVEQTADPDAVQGKAVFE